MLNLGYKSDKDTLPSYFNFWKEPKLNYYKIVKICNSNQEFDGYNNYNITELKAYQHSKDKRIDLSGCTRCI